MSNKAPTWVNDIYSFEKKRKSIQDSQQLINSIVSSADLDRTRTLRESIQNISKFTTISQAIEQARINTGFDNVNAVAFEQELDRLRQPVVPYYFEQELDRLRKASHIVKPQELLPQLRTVQHTMNDEMSSLNALTSTVVKASEANSSLSNFLLSRREAFKLITLKTTEIQALIDRTVASNNRISKHWESLTASLSSLSSLSASIQTGFVQTSTLQKTHQWLLEAPSIQTYKASRNIAQFIGIEEEAEIEVEESIALYKDECDTVLDRLMDLGLEFADTFSGAKEAIAFKRRDYIRHASVSLRELLDKLLEHLVPVDILQNWVEGAELFKKGQTRKARLKYLFRKLNSGAYADFAEKDIDLILQTFYALNKGTHTLASPFTDEAMCALVARVEGHLLTLLTAADL